MRAAIATRVVIAALFLVALWAFVSYLEPAFTGEQAAALLRCG